MANGTEMKESKKVKAGKKRFYKRWWFKAFAIIVVLNALASGNSKEKPTTEVQETSHATVAAEAATEAVQETEAAEETQTEATEAEYTVEPSIISNADTVIALIEPTLKDNWGDHYTIYNDEGVIGVNVWGEGVVAGAVMAANGDAKCKATWDEMVESLKRMCSSMCGVAEAAGMESVWIELNLVNDMNPDNILLSITNGVVFYDCVNMS